MNNRYCEHEAMALTLIRLCRNNGLSIYKGWYITFVLSIILQQSSKPQMIMLKKNIVIWITNLFCGCSCDLDPTP